MANAIGTLIVRITGDSKQFQTSMLATEKSLSNTGLAATRFGSTLSKGLAIGAAGAVVGLGLVVAGLASCVGEAMESQKVMAEVEAVIKTTGGAANITGKEIETLSGKLRDKTGYDDEQIASAAAMLLTFPKVRNEVGASNDIFSQALDLSTDMARKFGMDVPQAAKLLGKALGEPVRGVTALQRMGVMLTDQQKEQVKAMVASGDILGAQKVILREVSTEVGLVAEAYGNTLAGKIDIAKSKFGDMKEEIGNALLPVLTDLMNKIGSWDWAGIGKGIGKVAADVGNTLGNILKGKNETFNTIANVFKTIATEAIRLAPTLLKLAAAFAAFKIISGVSSAIATLGVSLAGLGGSLGNAGAALAVFSGPIGWVIGGVAALAGGIWYLTNAHKQHEKAAKENTIALGKLKDETRESALAAQPLVAEWKNLQDTIQGSTATDEEKAAAQTRLKEVTGQIADILPNAIQGWDDEGNAILVDTDKMNALIEAKLKYAGIKVEAKGEAGKYEGLAKTFEQDQNEGKELNGIVGDIGKTMASMERDGKKVFSSTEVDRVTEAYRQNAAQGDKVWKVLADAKGILTSSRKPWQETNIAQEEMTRLTGLLDGKYTEFGSTVVATDDKLIETRKQMKAVGEAMVAAAGDAGKTGKAMGPELSQSIGSALISKLPALKTLGTQAAAKYAEGMLSAQGKTGPEYTKLAQDIANLIATGANWNGTGGELGKQLYDGMKTQLRDGMVAMAGEAGAAGKELGKSLAGSVGTALKSANAVTKQGGADAAAKYAEGLFASQGQVGDAATAMAQHIANLIATGADYDGTGGKIGKDIYDSIKAQLKGAGIVITPTVDPDPAKRAMDSVLDTFGNFIKGKKIDAKVSVETTQASKNVTGLKTNIAEVKDKGVTASTETAQASKNVTGLRNNISGLTDKTITMTVVTNEVKTNTSPERSWSSAFAAGEYVAGEIGAGMQANAPTISAMVSGGGAGAYDTTSLNAFAAAQDAMKASADAASAGFDKEIDRLTLLKVQAELAGDAATKDAREHDIEVNGLLKQQSELTNSQKMVNAVTQKVSDSYNKLNGAYNQGTTALAGYQSQMDSADARLGKLKTSQDALNASLQKHQDALSQLSSMGIAGAGARDDKSFAMQQALNVLQLGILNAQKAGDKEKAKALEVQKTALENDKSIYDLQTGIDYDAKERSLQKMLDPLKGQEMSYEKIRKSILAEQKAIAAKEKQLRGVGKQIKLEETAVAKLNKKFEATTKIVDNLKNLIDSLTDSLGKAGIALPAGAGHHGGGLIMHGGGLVDRFQYGGLKSNERPSILELGEYVMRDKAVDQYGVGFMTAINQGKYQPSVPGNTYIFNNPAFPGVKTALDMDQVKKYMDSETSKAAHLRRVLE